MTTAVTRRTHVTLIGGVKILATRGFSSVSPAVFTCTV